VAWALVPQRGDRAQAQGPPAQARDPCPKGGSSFSTRSQWRVSAGTVVAEEKVVSVQYVPVACRSCRRAALAPVGKGDGPTCERCGARASVVPGEVYPEDDLGLFEKLEQVVHAAQLSEPSASNVTLMLSEVSERTIAPHLLLARALNVLPGLGFLVEVADQPARLAHALGMLLPIIGIRFRHPSDRAPSGPAP